MTDEELIAQLRVGPEYVYRFVDTDHAAADRIAALVKERDEAIRRRDAWKSKAEGYDAVRNALREKVGAPWPPNLSRAMWAGIAADEKKRADDAEAEVEKLRAIAAIPARGMGVKPLVWQPTLDGAGNLHTVTVAYCPVFEKRFYAERPEDQARIEAKREARILAALAPISTAR